MKKEFYPEFWKDIDRLFPRNPIYAIPRWFGNTFREIKWAWQRAYYGYDETIKWGFDSYFAMFVKPLKEFCIENMPDDDTNAKRIEIYSKTLELINEFEKEAENYENQLKEDNAESRLWKYFGEHIRWFWD